MLFCSLSIMDLVPVLVILVFLFTLVCRWRIFKKMGLRPWLGLIPVVREYKIFKRCWKVWPFVLLAVLTAVFGSVVQTTAYMDLDLPIPPFIKSNFMVLAIICLMIITVMMYKHLAFVFGHDIGYVMGLLFLNPIFLGLLAFSKNTFHEELAHLKGKEFKEYTMTNRTLTNRILSAVSAVLIVCTSMGYIGYVMFAEHQPGFVIERNLSKTYKTTEGKVSGNGEVIYPAAETGDAQKGDAQKGAGADRSDGVRDLYFPDKSSASETTVYMYLVGSDLEDTTGSASINLAQIKDATAAGDKLKFIIEAGGTGRWFTDGFKRGRVARYIIKDGKVERLEILPRSTSMSEQSTLKDFLVWANKDYPSDRRMLFFWDHGGGLAGFGMDIINPGVASGKSLIQTAKSLSLNSMISSRASGALLSMEDIQSALQEAGDKYDLIAFDACLMQTMEVGQALEPYADYLLASEEKEPSSGMFYTAAFSKLAQQPGLDTLKFGAMMCSSYDQSLQLLCGVPQAGYTLSMTDLRYIPVVQETFIGYLDGLDEQFRTSKSSFIQMSTARSQAYEFQMEDQIDLIDFINQSSIAATEKAEMIGRISNAVAVRSAASANHINGLAVYMPYDDLDSYTNMYRNLKDLGMKSETKVYNDFASILGSQKSTKESGYIGYYRDKEWFVDDFEDYDVSAYRNDIPLIKRDGGYDIDLTDREWATIVGCEQGLKIKVGSRYADLGSRNTLAIDGQGHPRLKFNEKWLAINNILVAVHPGQTRRGKDGLMTYTGTVDASLNFMEPITIYIEWKNWGGTDISGKILGYLPSDKDSDDIDESGMPRGIKQFKSSNTVTFRYDWYDKDGNYLSTALGHWPISVGMYGLKLSQRDISSEDYEYYGILKDVMNRTMKTEILHNKGKKSKK